MSLSVFASRTETVAADITATNEQIARATVFMVLLFVVDVIAVAMVWLPDEIVWYPGHAAAPALTMVLQGVLVVAAAAIFILRISLQNIGVAWFDVHRRNYYALRAKTNEASLIKDRQERVQALSACTRARWILHAKTLLSAAAMFVACPIAMFSITYKAMIIPYWWGYSFLAAAGFLTVYQLFFNWSGLMTVERNVRIILSALVIGGCLIVVFVDPKRPFDFRYADIQGIDVSALDLSDADGRDSNASNADFSWTNLIYADFAESQAPGARFDGADMTRTNFLLSNLKGASFIRMQAARPRFPNADLSDANFQEVSFRGVDFRLAKLHRANFVDASIYRGDFRSADASNAVFGISRIIQGRMTASIFDGADLRGTNARESDFTRASMNGANLTGANFYSTVFYAGTIKGSNLTLANFNKSIFVYANVQGSNFSGASLKETLFLKSDMRGVNLQGADLTDSDLRDADLRGANLELAYLERANLTGADLSDVKNLKQFQLYLACGDETTKLPPGLRLIKPCPNNNLLPDAESFKE